MYFAQGLQRYNNKLLRSLIFYLAGYKIKNRKIALPSNQR